MSRALVVHDTCEPPASRCAGTPFNSPSERGREMCVLRKKGRFG